MWCDFFGRDGIPKLSPLQTQTDFFFDRPTDQFPLLKVPQNTSQCLCLLGVRMLRLVIARFNKLKNVIST